MNKWVTLTLIATSPLTMSDMSEFMHGWSSFPRLCRSVNVNGWCNWTVLHVCVFIYGSWVFPTTREMPSFVNTWVTLTFIATSAFAMSDMSEFMRVPRSFPRLCRSVNVNGWCNWTVFHVCMFIYGSWVFPTTREMPSFVNKWVTTASTTTSPLTMSKSRVGGAAFRGYVGL